MGFEDRAYSRGPGQGPMGSILNWLLMGSIPLFTLAGIRVRAHSSLVLLIGLVMLFGLGQGFGFHDRLMAMSVLFVVVLLHEFGHCFAARAVGGTADDILMSPLGGLAYASPPRRPLPTFITVACGPLVNVVLMLIAAVVMLSLGGSPSWNPFAFSTFPDNPNLWLVFGYTAWFFQLNYWLLLFNLTPSYPLDGGQILQTALWRPLGYYRSMLTAVTIGIGGAALMMVFGIVASLLLVFIGLSCLLTCIQMRRQLLAAGPWAFEDEDSDYSAASWRFDPEQDRKSSRAMERELARQQRQAERDRADQERVDKILEKVSRSGMQSLTFFEKRALKQASARLASSGRRRMGRR